jgi:predicted RNA-binding Zn-ribbon protein involved in translation (DUF1610 family)
MQAMTDLTDRMRTCAAAIVAGDTYDHGHDIQLLMRDAADLLVEASNALEESGVGTVVMDQATAQALGLEPMEIIPPLTPADRGKVLPEFKPGVWIAPGGPLPYSEGLEPELGGRGDRPPKDTRLMNPRACPKCDSRTQKKVHRDGKRLMFECPVCGEQWEWRALAQDK